MDMRIEQADRVAVAAIRTAVPELVAIYRFGSSVTGERTPGSDVDLAVLAATPIDPLRRFDLQERLASALGQSVDLVDLRAASPVMAIQIIGKGRVLLDEDAPARGRFEDLIFGVYARLNEERRGILQRVAAEGTVYGR
jgi:predicted nucleotidyltransferase